MGGAALFSLMACCGDIGCTIGPAFVGFVSKAYNDNLKIGLLWSIFLFLFDFFNIVLYNKIVV